jgi:hypothetical protein
MRNLGYTYKEREKKQTRKKRGRRSASVVQQPYTKKKKTFEDKYEYSSVCMNVCA